MTATTSGVFAAALTPLHEDLSPDHALFARHCRWLLANGCDGLSVLGTTGEANSFSREERIEMLDRLLAAGVPAGRLLPGTGCCAIPDTVALSRHATAAWRGRGARPAAVLLQGRERRRRCSPPTAR